MTIDHLIAFGTALVAVLFGQRLAAYWATKRDNNARAIVAEERRQEREKAWAVLEARVVDSVDTVHQRLDKIELRLDRIVYAGSGNGSGGGSVPLRAVSDAHDG